MGCCKWKPFHQPSPATHTPIALYASMSASTCHFFLQMSHRQDLRAPPEREERPFKTGFSPSMGLMPAIISALGVEAGESMVQD